MGGEIGGGSTYIAVKFFDIRRLEQSTRETLERGRVK